MKQAAHLLKRCRERFSLSSPTGCMAALLAESILSRMPMALFIVGVSLDCSQWAVLERFFSRFMSSLTDAAAFLEPCLDLCLAICVLIFRVGPYCIDFLCQYALLRRLRGDSSTRREVVVLTACIRLAAGFLLLVYLRKDEPALGALGGLIIAIGTVLPDTLIWMALGLFAAWRLSRRARCA